MSRPGFNEFAEAYEVMIDWPKRLAHEEGLYRWLFERVGAQRVLDAACGTGRHATMFHSWGLSVEGADVSPAMIERCRQSFGESDTLRWAVRGYTEPHPQPGRFDAAVCVGNSLALAGETPVVEEALNQMLAAVRPGGVVLVHVLNLWRLPDGPAKWQKCIRAPLSQGDSLIVKGVHRAGGMGYVNMIVTRIDTPAPEMKTECVPFLGLTAEALEALLRKAGASQVEFFGGYQREPYQAAQSSDLIAVAIKAPAR